jgi:phytoene dehydrogenase-like protein
VHPRSDVPQLADVVVVGSALSGLVAAAILTRHGKRVVVLEHADTVGGRGGGVRTPDGYWIDFGHRDGHDVGDCQFPWFHGVDAARDADVTVALRPVARPLRVHRFPDDAMVDAGDWSAEGFLAMARDALECPPDAAPELATALARLRGAAPHDVDAALPVRLDRWLASHVEHPDVRRAILLLAAVIFHPRPEEASAGRLMEFLQRPRAGGPFLADDDEVGGMQGLVEPFARAARERGGEIALGWKPVEILVTEGRAAGVLAVDRTNLVREIRAPVVIGTYPLWEHLALLDPVIVPPELRTMADALAGCQADLVGWVAALRRMPRVRATGELEDFAGWNRLLRGPERRYHGGWHIPSLSSRRVAPAGRHLLHLVIARFFRGTSGPGETWLAARARLDDAIAYLHRYYADLDACTEWSSYHCVAAPQSMSWAWAPLRRHGITMLGVRGLLLAGSTVEGPAAVVDLGAWAGRAAAHEALALLAAPT